jgi:HD-GYP domain-containing protein (c-di-GMP phosphodiesterase class II)
MKKVTKVYVGFVFAVAIAATVGMYFLNPTYQTAEIEALAFFSVIAIVSEMLSFTLAREVRGSVAFIPYFASVILVPNWTSILAVTFVKWSMETLARIDRRKAVFNAANHGITLAAGIAVYLGLGGRSLLGTGTGSLSAIAQDVGVAAVLGFASAFLVNGLLVSIAIALESGESLTAWLRQNLISAIGGDLMSTPVIFVFAWVYATFGMMAAAVSWIPFLGLRHVSRANADLQKTNEELLQLMVKSIEARDPYTSGHSRRVSKYAVAIARLAGCSQNEIKDIGNAALLHDVGKIYEKYGPILSSSGRLSASEWAIMQEHPIDGANLVNTISKMRHLVPAVRHHHENWDGTGYPDRVAGEEIPLASRIIMFADTIDAMTSERPYRRPLSEEDVCAELVRCRGKQFDPHLADRLLAAGVWKTLFGEAKSRGLKKLELISSKTA